MINIPYSINTQEDVVLTSETGTEGNHQTLDYIPGSVIRGSGLKNFDRFDPPLANCFRQDGIIFGNAYLSAGEDRFFPVPLSFHADKKAGLSKTYNLATKQKEPEIQYKQIRARYFKPSEYLASVKKGQILKTSIEDNQMAGEGQLFSYQTIAKGQNFSGNIFIRPECSNMVDTITIMELTENIRFIGRSKSSEFGSVEVSLGTPAESPDSHIISADTDSILIFFYSDYALLQKTGIHHSAIATPEEFGIDSRYFNINYEKSFLRTRSYIPYNNHKQIWQRGRFLVIKGSVLVLERIQRAPQDIVIPLFSGLYNAEGYGQLEINPAWLNAPEYSLQEYKQKANNKADEVHRGSLSPESRSFIEWLEKAHNENKILDSTEKKAEKMARDLIKIMKILGESIPSSSQWSQIRNICETQSHWEDAENAVFGKEGITGHGVSAKIWKQEVKGKSIDTHLKEMISGEDVNQRSFLLAKVSKKMAEEASKNQRSKK